MRQPRVPVLRQALRASRKSGSVEAWKLGRPPLNGRLKGYPDRAKIGWDSNNQPRIEDRGSGSGLGGGWRRGGEGRGRHARLQRQCDNAQVSVLSVERCDLLSVRLTSRGHAALLVATGSGRSQVKRSTQCATTMRRCTLVPFRPMCRAGVCVCVWTQAVLWDAKGQARAMLSCDGKRSKAASVRQ